MDPNDYKAKSSGKTRPKTKRKQKDNGPSLCECLRDEHCDSGLVDTVGPRTIKFSVFQPQDFENSRDNFCQEQRSRMAKTVVENPCYDVSPTRKLAAATPTRQSKQKPLPAAEVKTENESPKRFETSVLTKTEKESTKGVVTPILTKTEKESPKRIDTSVLTKTEKESPKRVDTPALSVKEEIVQERKSTKEKLPSVGEAVEGRKSVKKSLPNADENVGKANGTPVEVTAAETIPNAELAEVKTSEVPSKEI